MKNIFKNLFGIKEKVSNEDRIKAFELENRNRWALMYAQLHEDNFKNMIIRKRIEKSKSKPKWIHQ